MTTLSDDLLVWARRFRENGPKSPVDEPGLEDAPILERAAELLLRGEQDDDTALFLVPISAWAWEVKEYDLFLLLDDVISTIGHKVH